jgi:hypothetical protein
MDERQITHPDEQQKGKDNQTGDHFRQFAPDAEIHIHPGELSTRGAPAKADFTRRVPSTVSDFFGFDCQHAI